MLVDQKLIHIEHSTVMEHLSSHSVFTIAGTMLAEFIPVVAPYKMPCQGL